MATPTPVIPPSPVGGQDADVRLAAVLRGLGPVAVAFSGGTDSVALAAAVAEVMPGACLAVFADTPLQPQAEREACRELATAIGIPLATVTVRLQELPFIADNPPDRCYHCKRFLFTRLLATARASGYETLVDGTQRDDLSDYRPGRRALAELGIHSPLLTAGWNKADVLASLARRGLRVRAAPGGACLATRLPHGEPITAAKLAAVEQAEASLHALGFAVVRVRHHGELARIELPAQDLLRVQAAGALRAAVEAAVRAAGYGQVTLDPAGYRRGGMNAPVAGPPQSPPKCAYGTATRR